MTFLTVVYAIFCLPLGGLTAVIFTDVLQCAIMIVGAIVLAILSKQYLSSLALHLASFVYFWFKI